MTQHTFYIMMSPKTLLEIGAPDSETAVAAARDALPHLHLKKNEQDEAILVDGQMLFYRLSCLICGAVNPERAGKSYLIAIQEHLMEEHRLTLDDIRANIRVFLGTADEGCYVWALLPKNAERLQLTHLSYMRAARFTTKIPVLPPQQDMDGYTKLVFIHPFDGSTTQCDVDVLYEDALAWYGYLRGNTRTGNPYIWPKKEWTSKGERGKR